MLGLRVHPNKAQTIGLIAAEAVNSSQVGHVHGITSRGLFIRTSRRWIIFVTNDPFLGPCTVTAATPIFGSRNIYPGASVFLSSSDIRIPSAQLVIDLRETSVWQPASPPAPVPFSNQLENLASLSEQVLAAKPNAPLSILLTGRPASSSEKENMLLSRVRQISDLLANRGISSILPLLKTVLGLGSGLTPSGDDFLIGLLLCWNRWPQLLGESSLIDLPYPEHAQLTSINKQLIEAAYQKTTTISANLIECAARGLADERLIQALDYLVAGVYPKEDVAANLLTWGSSSGIDAMIGMRAAILAYRL